jgi:hypothetical protein
MPSVGIIRACARRSRRNAALLVLASLASMALGPAPAQAKVYFSAFLAEGGTGIERADFEGFELETLQSEPTGFADGIALDTATGKMYWTDTDASVIWSANLDGSDAQVVLDDFGAEPVGIALDIATGKMYWTDRDGVKRANLDGTDQEVLTREPARGFIALDLSTGQMYWADWPSGVIKTAAMTTSPTVTDLVKNQLTPFGVAVDEGTGRAYWLDLDLGRKKHEQDQIRSANLAGGEVKTVVIRPGAGFEGGLAIEAAAGKLYWTEAGARDIGVANLDGSQAQTLFSTGEDIPEGLAVESDDASPTNTAAPFIEGSAQVGDPLSCNPGTWAGTGTVSFGYQWETVGGAPIEGATGDTYVPSLEQAGTLLVCLVTATDDVATSYATSAPVSIAAIASEPDATPVGVVATPLVAGIAVADLTASGTKVRVPVFTSLAGTATLTATPVRPPSKRKAATKRAHIARKASRALQRRRSKKAAGPTRLTVHKLMRAGRGTVTLQGLVPGTTYRLSLTIESLEGQSSTDTATLTVRAR